MRRGGEVEGEGCPFPATKLHGDLLASTHCMCALTIRATIQFLKLFVQFVVLDFFQQSVAKEHSRRDLQTTSCTTVSGRGFSRNRKL